MNLAGVCTVEGTLALARMMCDNREFCFLFAHTDSDPCPTVSKYLEVIFSCEQNGEDTSTENVNMNLIMKGLNGKMCSENRTGA